MMAKPTREIPASVTTTDADGKQTHKPMSWRMLPPPADRCQICGAKHEPDEPHYAGSLYYQMTFHGMVGRMPTWADAVAHCPQDIRGAWETELRQRDAWTEPPHGEAPVRHHGLDG